MNSPSCKPVIGTFVAIVPGVALSNEINAFAFVAANIVVGTVRSSSDSIESRLRIGWAGRERNARCINRRVKL